MAGQIIRSQDHGEAATLYTARIENEARDSLFIHGSHIRDVGTGGTRLYLINSMVSEPYSPTIVYSSDVETGRSLPNDNKMGKEQAAPPSSTSRQPRVMLDRAVRPGPSQRQYDLGVTLKCRLCHV